MVVSRACHQDGWGCLRETADGIFQLAVLKDKQVIPRQKRSKASTMARDVWPIGGIKPPGNSGLRHWPNAFLFCLNKNKERRKVAPGKGFRVVQPAASRDEAQDSALQYLSLSYLLFWRHPSPEVHSSIQRHSPPVSSSGLAWPILGAEAQQYLHPECFLPFPSSSHFETSTLQLPGLSTLDENMYVYHICASLSSHAFSQMQHALPITPAPTSSMAKIGWYCDM